MDSSALDLMGNSRLHRRGGRSSLGDADGRGPVQATGFHATIVGASDLGTRSPAPRPPIDWRAQREQGSRMNVKLANKELRQPRHSAHCLQDGYSVEVSSYMPTPSRVRRPETSTEDHPMETILHVPMLMAAIQYSIIYMLLGGGVFGAIVVYFVAKVLGK